MSTIDSCRHELRTPLSCPACLHPRRTTRGTGIGTFRRPSTSLVVFAPFTTSVSFRTESWYFGLSLVSPWSLLGLSLVSPWSLFARTTHSATQRHAKDKNAQAPLSSELPRAGRKLIRRLRLAHRSGQKRKRLALFLRVPSHQSTGGVFASCVSRPHFALSTCVRFRRHFSLVTSSTLRRTTRRRRTLGGNGRGRESRARADFSRLRDGRWDFRQDFGQDPRVQLERCVDFAVLRSARDRHRRLDIRSTARRSSPMMASVFLAGGCLARAPKTGQGGSKPRRDGMTKRAATWVPVQSRVGIDA